MTPLGARGLHNNPGGRPAAPIILIVRLDPTCTRSYPGDEAVSPRLNSRRGEGRLRRNLSAQHTGRNNTSHGIQGPRTAGGNVHYDTLRTIGEESVVRGHWQQAADQSCLKYVNCLRLQSALLPGWGLPRALDSISRDYLIRGRHRRHRTGS